MHNDSTPSPARRHDLDALRAFAMLLGIALHAALSFVRFPWIVQDSRQHDGFGLFFVAVHGFRMPLFFLLSGFFTAMLWRRRGLRSLLAQRVRRIVLPLGLCMVTFVPATTWVSGVALRSGMKSGATAPRKAAADVGIWRAVRQGDVGAIQGHLVDGADVDELHPQLEVTPLALAAVLGRVDVVDVLVRAGANVDARDGNGATALHGAAFFGHAGVVRRLIEGGADPNAQTDAGATAAESLATDWATTQFIAAIVGYPADRDRVLAGREEVAEALDGATGVSRPAPVDIWSAAQRGDVDAVEALLDAGTDVDGRHPESGGTPLAIAALFDQTDVVALLLRRGADVDARGGDGATALHAAAFFGRAGAAELLIEAGADLEARNGSGSTAGESLAATWELTEFIAGMIQIDVDEPEVMEGREQVAALLAERGSGGGVRPSPRSGRWVQRARRLMAASVFHHLWFLWFLCWLVPAFAVYALVADRVGWSGAPNWLVLSPARLLWLIPLTLAPQWYMGRVPGSFGPDTSAGLLPTPQVLLYYAIFFGFGAMYYDANDEVGRVGRWWRVSLPAALLVALPLGLASSMGELDALGKLGTPTSQRALSVAMQVTYAWAMTLGLMGLCRAVLTRERPWVRYVSDSSYWLYIAHLPLIIWAQLVVRHWHVPALLKFSLVCGVVTGALLLTYQTVVRYTALGTLLNGPRQRRSARASGSSSA